MVDDLVIERIARRLYEEVRPPLPDEYSALCKWEGEIEALREHWRDVARRVCEIARI